MLEARLYIESNETSGLSTVAIDIERKGCDLVHGSSVSLEIHSLDASRWPSVSEDDETFDPIYDAIKPLVDGCVDLRDVNLRDLLELGVAEVKKYQPDYDETLAYAYHAETDGSIDDVGGVNIANYHDGKIVEQFHLLNRYFTESIAFYYNSIDKFIAVGDSCKRALVIEGAPMGPCYLVKDDIMKYIKSFENYDDAINFDESRFDEFVKLVIERMPRRQVKLTNHIKATIFELVNYNLVNENTWDASIKNNEYSLKKTQRSVRGVSAVDKVLSIKGLYWHAGIGGLFGFSQGPVDYFKQILDKHKSVFGE